MTSCRFTVKDVSPTLAATLVALWLVAVDNQAFWRTFINAQSSLAVGTLAVIMLGLALWLGAASVLRAFAWLRAAKLIWITLLLISAVAAHFVDFWGVHLDKAMMRNILETDLHEANDLMTRTLAADFAIRGLLPATLLLLFHLRTSTAASTLKSSVGLAVASLLVLTIAVATLSPVYASTFRNHRELRSQLVPSNYIGAMYSVLRPPPSRPFESVGTDASRTALQSRPLLVVLVVGETARADSFSLGDYGRSTNEALYKRQVLYFQNVTACGTDTATSLPCMFSDLGVKRFSVEAARYRENVLDLLKRVGVSVTWIDNNSGCKGVCDRVSWVSVNDTCPDNRCMDEVLISALAQYWPSTKEDALIVLHQQGSHGPAYFKRYPQPGRFTPACLTNNLQDCERRKIVNAYDNSIDYTSRVLAQLVTLLEGRSLADESRDLLLLYVSDHGESLGERGLYLHGIPTVIAPHEQVHVPMMMWMSRGAAARLAPNAACLLNTSRQAVSHDNLFHTLLGAFAVSTKVYRSDLDLFAPALGKASCPKTVPISAHSKG